MHVSAQRGAGSCIYNISVSMYVFRYSYVFFRPRVLARNLNETWSYLATRKDAKRLVSEEVNGI